MGSDDFQMDFVSIYYGLPALNGKTAIVVSEILPKPRQRRLVDKNRESELSPMPVLSDSRSRNELSTTMTENQNESAARVISLPSPM